MAVIDSFALIVSFEEQSMDELRQAIHRENMLNISFLTQSSDCNLELFVPVETLTDKFDLVTTTTEKTECPKEQI